LAVRRKERARRKKGQEEKQKKRRRGEKENFPRFRLVRMGAGERI